METIEIMCDHPYAESVAAEEMVDDPVVFAPGTSASPSEVVPAVSTAPCVASDAIISVCQNASSSCTATATTASLMHDSAYQPSTSIQQVTPNRASGKS